MSFEKFKLLRFLHENKVNEIVICPLEAEAICGLEETTGVQDFLIWLSKEDLIKIISVDIDYLNYIFNDKFLNVFFTLVKKGKIKEANKLAIDNGFPTLNTIIKGTKTLQDMYKLIRKALKEFGIDEEDCNIVFMDLTGYMSIKLTKTDKFDKYFNSYIEAYKKDNLKQIKRVPAKGFKDRDFHHKSYMTNEFYRYNKQREVFIDLLSKKLETQKPEKILIVEPEITYEHLNIYELFYCFKEDRIIKTIKKTEDLGRLKFQLSVDEEKIKQLTFKEKIIGVSSVNSDPTIFKEGKKGYLRFYKTGPKILLGKVETRKYKLMETLSHPFGTPKTVDSVFEAIRTTKDRIDGYLTDAYHSNRRKLEIINYTLKELQKIKGLKSKITLTVNKDRNTIILNLY